MPNMYGPHLKAVREEKGIKAAFVAHRIRVSPPTYSEIESGKRGLSAERLEAILAAIEMSPNDLRNLMRKKGRVAEQAASYQGREEASG